MKKLILILMISNLFMGCTSIMFTTHNLSKSSKVRAGMPTDEVLKIMGEPVVSELTKNVEEWHYCKTGSEDRFLAMFFVDGKLVAKKYYLGKSDFGDCSLFVKTGDYKIPPQVQAILDKNTPTPSELKEPKEPIDPKEGVIPTVPDVKIPEIEMNILDGNISSGSTTLKTEDIIKDCKKECVTFTISSDEWCDCMHQCSQKVIDKISFGDMNVKIYIEECP